MKAILDSLLKLIALPSLLQVLLLFYDLTILLRKIYNQK